MPAPLPPTGQPAWDLFCRVIDNFGDIGVCWRLARALARRGIAVRLWVDDASALAWMAPAGAPGVQVLAWDPAAPDPQPQVQPGAVVVEAFGCDPPPGFVARMAAQPRPPLWINLEYLSAEAYVERSHRLRSPQFGGPGAGLTKWFFYPGFTPATGGLLHDLPDDLRGDDAPARARAWAAARGWGPAAGERVATLFCYDNPALPALLATLATQDTRPTLLRVAPGPARARLDALALPAGLRRLDLPPMPQDDFDRLLASASAPGDLNVVRGEDSFVRAQLCSSAPFLWQIYPQHDGAHGPKLDAFLDRCLDGAAPALAAAVRQAQRGLNGLAPFPARLPDAAAWAAQHAAWRAQLLAQPDLCRLLLDFVTDPATKAR